MKKKRWEIIDEALADCLELASSERHEYLDGLNLPSDIYSEVESLLAFAENSEDLMNLSAVELAGGYFDDEKSENAANGQIFGPYQVVREIGSGGMGAVYLAERADGKFEQKVALKILKREMNTVAFRRRFQREREILASLEHPNIARLLNTGMTDDNIPYIAMEYVDGLPIAEYCDKNGFGINQRLDLFREVCATVDFAHRSLIVHRDLKPSNILVTQEGTPKLLDFGISKVLQNVFDSASSSTVTKLGAMTPGYSSPEQLQHKSVTTATDIYSLGIILFELLSGHRPFETRENDLREIYTAIIETDPPLPSSLAGVVRNRNRAGSGLRYILPGTSSAGTTQQNRTPQTQPRPVSLSSHLMRGDLDNIVLKALRKEPERRYSSAENFSDDIKRHLKGLPVTARPNTFGYRAEKFLKRNKVSVIAAVFVIIALFAGIAATLWQARVAEAERDRARTQAAKAEKVNEYLQNILNFSNPGWLSSNPEQNRKATVAEALDEAVKNLDVELADEPEIAGEVSHTIGQTYVYQGQYLKAERLLRQAIQKFDQVHGPNNLKSMRTSVILADTLYYLGKPEESEQFYLDAIEYFRPVVAEDKEQTKWLAIALTDLGNVHNLNGKFAEAERVSRESLTFAENLKGHERYIIPIILTNIGTAVGRKGENSRAVSYFEQALSESQKLGSDQKFEGAGTLYHLGITLNKMGRYDEAEDKLLQAYRIFTSSIGEETAFASSTNFHIARVYYSQEKYDQAEELLKKTLKLQQNLFPKGHFLLAYSRGLLGEVYTKTNRVKMGELELREAISYLTANVKSSSEEIGNLRISLARNLIMQKRVDEAQNLLVSALNNSLELYGEDHAVTKERREILDQITN